MKKKTGGRLTHILLKPKNIYGIYDYSNIDPNCLERFTFICEKVEPCRPGYNARYILGTSETGKGISIWNELEVKHIGNHLGKVIDWEDLSNELKLHVIRRMENE